ncbi:MAG: hypothetical protein WC526_03385 [Patescibacteria group bacterium]
MLGLAKLELKIFKKLNTPIKIQNFLDTFPINWEKKGETYMSPRRALKARKIHCLEGALLAATALWINGEQPLLLDLSAKGDEDHVVALYKRNGHFGAISKSNHATLRFRDPVYKTVRELVVSYFHEYFDNKYYKKRLVGFSKPLNLKKFGDKWVTAKEDLHYLVDALNDSPHKKIYPQKNAKFIRRADKMERQAGRLKEWKKSHPRT